MRLLVLGGSTFLSEAVAARAVGRGHDVVCANRSGRVPAGARHVAWDRAVEPVPTWPFDGPVDGVVDTTTHPSRARAVVEAPSLRAAHGVQVSTISVYADAADGSLLPACDDEGPATDLGTLLAADPLAYGGLKVACERAQERRERSLVVRPGLIGGPGDPSGRLTYWVERLARVAEQPHDPVVVPDPAAGVQVVDVRDLAAFVVTALERGTTGVLDVVGERTRLGDLLADVARGVGLDPERVPWHPASDAALTAADVVPWMGPRSLPLWIPRPDGDALMTHDPAPAVAAGLDLRPIADTAAATLAWLRAERAAGRPVATTGLTAAEEAALVASGLPTLGA